MIHAYAATEQKGELKPFEYDPGPLRAGDIEIDVHACGLCHSDVSVLHNEWGFSKYPIVAGHEVVGRVAARGEGVTHLNIGDWVGLGWYSNSCMVCRWCLGGEPHLCPQSEATIVRRYGGFADKVRCSAAWAVRLPSGIDANKVGPLFCGGITVFHPLLAFGVKPTDRVGVIGIGGLGHLALQFLNKWGCEVTAFTSSDSKSDEAKQMGAHRVVSSRDSDALKKEKGRHDFILSTVNVALDWSQYVAALAPKGRLHTVGAVLSPISVGAFDLIGGEKSVSGSPVGSPATVSSMLDFCVRHDIAPITEEFAMADINDAIEHLIAGNARYRIVLRNPDNA
ncbi:MAG: NAD(P)-dependent alcohol dehydrogenase [Polyangiales bacterium]